MDVSVQLNGLLSLDMIIRDSNDLSCAGQLAIHMGINDPTIGDVLCFCKALS